MARYELIERIGVGGMAEIFRGRAVAGGGFEKPVAIKRILPHLSQDKRFVELLITEANTLSQLRHRNVVQIYDVGLGDDGQYFLVMEYVDGVDCGCLADDFGRAGLRMPLEVALHVAGEVCEALEHAHRARRADGSALGLVHRDVTPSNILLSRSGEVKLTDFGIAKRMEEATGHGGVRGKFAYISPEQAINAHVDARSDVYSLGVVFYELALGKRLYSHLPDFEALRAVRDAQPPRVSERSDLDPELARILDTALAPRPDDRYPSAGTFGSILRSYRYSLSSSTADPATEIGRLVDAQRRGRIALEASAPMAPEPTVVRIATAAGFTQTRNEDGDAHTTRLAVDELFDDEMTHAVAPDTTDARGKPAIRDMFTDFGRTEASTTAEHLLGDETRVLASSTSVSAMTSGGSMSKASSNTLDTLDEAMEEGTAVHRAPPPKLPPPRRATALPPPPSLFGGLAAMAARRQGGEVAAMSSEEPTKFERPSSPTARDVFHPGLLLDARGPLPPPVHVLPREAGMSEARRRALFIAGTACIACAVAAFVVVGVVLGDRPAAAVAPDAAVQAVADAAPIPTETAPSDEATPGAMIDPMQDPMQAPPPLLSPSRPVRTAPRAPAPPPPAKPPTKPKAAPPRTAPKVTTKGKSSSKSSKPSSKSSSKSTSKSSSKSRKPDSRPKPPVKKKRTP